VTDIRRRFFSQANWEAFRSSSTFFANTTIRLTENRLLQQRFLFPPDKGPYIAVLNELYPYD